MKKKKHKKRVKDLRDFRHVCGHIEEYDMNRPGSLGPVYIKLWASAELCPRCKAKKEKRILKEK